MTEPSLLHRIQAYNKGRIPAVLAMKYTAMSRNAFGFLRGSDHLFFEDIPKDSPILQSPKTWICGDLHLENLGSFKGDNGLAYFDLNDFDEAALAPCLLDITRFACSVHVGADELGMDAKGAVFHVKAFLDQFATTLQKGYIRVLEKETAVGVIRQLLQTVQNRTRKEFLTGRVEGKKKPRLVTGTGHYIAISEEEQKRVSDAFCKTPLYKSNPEFFAIKDIAFRIAGTGSLGMERYAVLVEGHSGKGRYALIDIKEAQAPSLLLRHHFRQPAWTSQAERIVEIQKRVEAAAPALLSTMEIDGRHFVVKELQPMEDKLNLAHFGGKTKRCSQFIDKVGAICAWGALRSGGRQGSATADELIAFAGKADEWKKYVADYASKYAGKVRRDYAHFKKAYDSGKLTPER
ncbi:DUF2252 domain-containing protein [Dinghuibacter silviterrae]|uniref:Uncharacterized protein (DUF2252 family) n=1 Tax=Dinghuibacter silviterrae TaxID=1539049 RepID=A0A4R8DGJ0_9BACT|nr:DUF2252 family protein [Dinghuibacter silviterrae]TDW96779.1 uncharacterized protein (DUF2252 family) [Dinghuibacter silviterrae]